MADTLKLIDNFNDLLIDLEAKMFKSLDKSKRNEVVQRSRLALNDLGKKITKSALEDKSLEKEYVKKYNKIAGKLDDKVKIKKIGKESDKEVQDLKAEFVDSITESSELTQQAFEQKVNFFDSYIKNINIGSAFTPRVVLFQPGRFWDESEKDVIKKHFNETTRDIKKEINKQVKEGQTYPKTAKNITEILKKQYPDGNVPIPRRYTDKKTGKTRITMTSMPIERYADTWTKDMAQMNDSMAVVSSVKKAGYDLVKVAGGVTDNALCDPYSTPPAIYSLEGKVEGFPILTKFPPYHPNCSKYLTVTSEMKRLQDRKEKKMKEKIKKEYFNKKKEKWDEGYGIPLERISVEGEGDFIALESFKVKNGVNHVVLKLAYKEKEKNIIKNMNMLAEASVGEGLEENTQVKITQRNIEKII